MLGSHLKSFLRDSCSYAKKKIKIENTKKECFFVCLLSPLGLSPHLPLSSPPFISGCVLDIQNSSIFHRVVCFSNVSSLKGTTAKGSVAWQGFNYLNEVHSKKCWAFFLSTTPLQFVFFPLLIEINFPCCSVLQNIWMGLLF